MSLPFALEEQAIRIGHLANMVHLIAMAAENMDGLDHADGPAIYSTANTIERELHAVKREVDCLVDCWMRERVKETRS